MLDAVCKDAMGKIKASAFRHSKERVIIAEVFLNKMPNLREGGQKDLLALIKDAGNSKELRARLQHRESSTAGGSSFWSLTTSFFSSKEQTSRYLDEAVNQYKNTKDQHFLATLQERVFKEPLLEQFVQDVLTEAHQHFHWFMKQNIPRLYLHAHQIKQQAMYRKVEAEANEQDQKRRACARSDWCNKINMGQPQADSGYVSYIVRYLSLLSMCTRPVDTVFIHHIEEMRQGYGYHHQYYYPTTSGSPDFLTCGA